MPPLMPAMTRPNKRTCSISSAAHHGRQFISVERCATPFSRIGMAARMSWQPISRHRRRPAWRPLLTILAPVSCGGRVRRSGQRHPHSVSDHRTHHRAGCLDTDRRSQADTLLSASPCPRWPRSRNWSISTAARLLCRAALGRTQHSRWIIPLGSSHLLTDRISAPRMLASSTACRRSAIDGHTTRHPGYAISQRIANASRRPSAGPRRWRGCARCGIADCSRSIGNSPSRWPPMISSACLNCSLGMFNEPVHISHRECCAAGAHSTLRETRPPRNTEHRGNQNAPKSIFFPHPAWLGCKNWCRSQDEGCLVFR